MIDDDLSAVRENELLKLAACLISLRGWVARDAAVSLVVAGYATARVVALPPGQRTSNRPTIQVVDLDPRAEALVAEVRRLSQEDGGLLQLAQEPMPRVLKKWVVSEAFLRTLPRTHLRHVEARWWGDRPLFS